MSALEVMVESGPASSEDSKRPTAKQLRRRRMRPSKLPAALRIPPRRARRAEGRARAKAMRQKADVGQRANLRGTAFQPMHNWHPPRNLKAAQEFELLNRRKFKRGLFPNAPYALVLAAVERANKARGGA
jgi:hypothetical protein